MERRKDQDPYRYKSTVGFSRWKKRKTNLRDAEREMTFQQSVELISITQENDFDIATTANSNICSQVFKRIIYF